ncbi:MAG: 1-(5-phosphoribosyl)-5-[(5-phosphoribosylamino)methylideneamino] imidazole-4-carboxamide isomerase [Actinobacteria bacterium]|nr:1-(5-phosphoribosyl)-5-[(5-phosphoribosylamino)methylideneamino] imidazole-4-carboxamide isomerase [Actinomycetota bacterium]MCL5447511.1 1-(5-phosphoribosyl)-5-[(5-phosphoribosylamino)methylideneamino] imidazole-4-carboxamide isomerase [Actinomycetota bacterium]
MKLYPAVDIHGGTAVRLFKGEYAKVTDFGDPVELALGYVSRGARRLHVVDLDGARTGSPANREAVVEITRKCGVPVQVGGGIRTADDVEWMLSAGVARAVLGTTALLDPAATIEVARSFPGSVAISLDYKGNAACLEGGTPSLCVSGWEEDASVDLREAVEMYNEVPLAALVVTAIDRDGTMEGPDTVGLRYVLEVSGHPVILAGGVRDVSDLKDLAAISVGGKGVAGVISGRAIANGSLSLEEAVKVCEE